MNNDNVEEIYDVHIQNFINDLYSDEPEKLEKPTKSITSDELRLDSEGFTHFTNYGVNLQPVVNVAYGAAQIDRIYNISDSDRNAYLSQSGYQYYPGFVHIQAPGYKEYYDESIQILNSFYSDESWEDYYTILKWISESKYVGAMHWLQTIALPEPMILALGMYCGESKNKYSASVDLKTYRKGYRWYNILEYYRKHAAEISFEAFSMLGLYISVKIPVDMHDEKHYQTDTYNPVGLQYLVRCVALGQSVLHSPDFYSCLSFRVLNFEKIYQVREGRRIFISSIVKIEKTWKYNVTWKDGTIDAEVEPSGHLFNSILLGLDITTYLQFLLYWAKPRQNMPVYNPPINVTEHNPSLGFHTSLEYVLTVVANMTRLGTHYVREYLETINTIFDSDFRFHSPTTDVVIC
jgi:hypothetical protein